MEMEKKTVILFDVFVEGESRIRDDAKVQEVEAGENSGTMMRR